MLAEGARSPHDGPGATGLSGFVLNLLPGWGYRAGVWEALLAHLPAEWETNLVELPWEHPTEEWLRPNGPLAARLKPGWCVGWSFGGTLALALAAHASTIDGVVLVASTPCWLAAPDWTAGLERQAIEELRALVDDQPEAALRHFNALVSLGAPNAAQVRRALAHHLLPGEMRPGLTAALGLMQRLDARLTRPAVPVRLIEGEGDRLLPGGVDPHWVVTHARSWSRLPGMGHALHLADPAALAACLRHIGEPDGADAAAAQGPS
ncbi:MAG TPA: hypothetical protein DCY89_04320 [Gammaproteobacteria bacterium]|nr:hypothetical protein [Gammaproteobacteria bacterium]